MKDTLVGAIIRKSRIGTLRLNYGNGYTKNCLIEQCRIAGVFYPDKESENLCIKNSVIHIVQGNSPSATLLIENCLFTHYISPSTTALLRNNIINGVDGGNISLSSNCSAFNNIFIKGNADGVAIKYGNNLNISITTLFGRNSINPDEETYELTPEAKATYLGTDGTQVGIYGGENPFTNVPTNPQIISKSIDGKSSADGKLKVNIKVEAQK